MSGVDIHFRTKSVKICKCERVTRKERGNSTEHRWHKTKAKPMVSVEGTCGPSSCQTLDAGHCQSAVMSATRAR